MAAGRITPPSQQSPTSHWAEIALILLIFFIHGGAPVPHVNEAHYLAKAKHYWNPAWCAGDLFLESADPHLVFYWTLGVLTKWLSLPTVAWLGRLAAWTGLAWAWQRLSWQIVPVRYVAVVTALLLITLINVGHFAGEWIVGGVESKAFAYIFVCWALAELARGRWRAVWPLLGLASALHVLVGGWSVFAAMVVWMVEDKEVRPRFISLLPSLMLGGLLALLGIIPGLLLSQGVPAEIQAEANRIYVFERLPHHLAPLSLAPAELLTRASGFGLLLAAFVWLWRTCLRQQQPHDALQRIQRFAAASILIGALGLLWEVATWNQPTLSAKLLKFYWFRLSDIAVPLAIALSLGWLLNREHLPQSRATTILRAAIFVIPACLLFQTAANRGIDNTAPSDSKLADRFAWQEVCEWARTETPPGSLFLIPRQASSFKWYAERPDYFNWKDVPQDPASIVEWFRRFQELYFHENPWGERVAYNTIGEIGTHKLEELAKLHHIDFVIAEEYPPLGFPVVFENAWFTIYRTHHPATTAPESDPLP